MLLAKLVEEQPEPNLGELMADPEVWVGLGCILLVVAVIWGLVRLFKRR